MIAVCESKPGRRPTRTWNARSRISLPKPTAPVCRRLAVKVSGGNVTLRGCVASFYEKQIAIQACRMLTSLDRLIDAVEVAAAN